MIACGQRTTGIVTGSPATRLGSPTPFARVAGWCGVFFGHIHRGTALPFHGSVAMGAMDQCKIPFVVTSLALVLSLVALGGLHSTPPTVAAPTTPNDAPAGAPGVAGSPDPGDMVYVRMCIALAQSALRALAARFASIQASKQPTRRFQTSSPSRTHSRAPLS